MKRVIPIAALSLVALLLSTTGCNTTPPLPGQPSQLAINIAIGLDATVPLTVATIIQSKPETVSYFTAAALVIEGATSTGGYNPAALLAALDAIPGSSQGVMQYAKLAIAAGVNLYAGLSRAGIITATDANYCLSHFASDVRMGLPPETVESVKAKTKTVRAKYAKIISKG